MSKPLQLIALIICARFHPHDKPMADCGHPVNIAPTMFNHRLGARSDAGSYAVAIVTSGGIPCPTFTPDSLCPMQILHRQLSSQMHDSPIHGFV